MFSKDLKSWCWELGAIGSYCMEHIEKSRILEEHHDNFSPFNSDLTSDVAVVLLLCRLCSSQRTALVDKSNVTLARSHCWALAWSSVACPGAKTDCSSTFAELEDIQAQSEQLVHWASAFQVPFGPDSACQDCKHTSVLRYCCRALGMHTYSFPRMLTKRCRCSIHRWEKATTPI